MLGKLAELLVFGLMPLAVGMLVIPDHAAATEKVVAGEAAPSIVGKDWKADFIDGIGTLPEPRATLHISEDGRIGGKGPCNGYFASVKIDGTALAISQPGATQMACAPELMQAEHGLFEALPKVAAYRLVDGALSMLDKDGREVLRFVPAG